ncbi:hypothetical protein J4216_06815 [Candidatus Woesearchaeota archaeon]|nr:hypothetical protein [Candidatus Woesearchaeota archaeon]
MNKNALDLNERDLEILLQDFGRVSEKILEYPKAVRKYRANLDQGIDDHSELDDEDYINIKNIKLYNDKLAYYSTPSDIHGKPFGCPKDYLDIKYKPEIIKEFIGKTLDYGKIPAGYNGVCDSSRVINSSEYIIWLYKYSESLDFKSLLSKSTVDLLREELNRYFQPLDITEDLERERQRFIKDYSTLDDFFNQMFFRDNILEKLKKPKDP